MIAGMVELESKKETPKFGIKKREHSESDERVESAENEKSPYQSKDTEQTESENNKKVKNKNRSNIVYVKIRLQT